MDESLTWAEAYRRRLAVTDALVIAWALTGAHVARFGAADTDLAVGRYAPSYLLISLLLAVAWWLSLSLFGTRDTRIIGVGPEEYKRVVGTCLRLFGSIAIVAFLAQAQVARGYLAVAFPVGTLGLLLARWLWRQWLHLQRHQGEYSDTVVVVGSRNHVEHLVRELRRNPTAGLRVVGACVPGGHVGDMLEESTVPVLGGLAGAAEAALDVGASTVAVTASEAIGPTALRKLGWDLEAAGVDLVVAPSLTDVAGPRVHSRPVAGLPLLHVEAPRYEGASRATKKVFDLTLTSLGLVVLSPVLALIALAVAVDSRGPVLFRQERIGLGGEPFAMLKFRSMVADADTRLADLSQANQGSGPLFKMRDDPRVTRVGRLMRRYSLDELPQLVNVLRGDMSLVGPRPPLLREVETYADDVRRRLLVRPGITGLWQVSGRSDLSWEDSVRLDLYYVENWSLTSDVVILWRTLRAVVSSAGAY
ncbi:MAG: sugar transferase [Nocardioidaceae bacterium]